MELKEISKAENTAHCRTRRRHAREYTQTCSKFKDTPGGGAVDKQRLLAARTIDPEAALLWNIERVAESPPRVARVHTGVDELRRRLLKPGQHLGLDDPLRTL